MPPATTFPPSEAAVLPVLATLAAGATVVTANKRAAAWLRECYDAAQTAAGRAAWPTPRIMPWSSWVRGLWQALRADTGGARHQVLTPWQEQRIWATVIGADAEHTGLHMANAGTLAANAWEVVHGWRGPWAQWGGEGAREEHRAFVAWAEAFVRECAAHDWIDLARLPLLIIDALRSGAGHIIAPTAFYGFAEFSPQQQALVEALDAAGVRVTQFAPADVALKPANEDALYAVRLGCADPADEWRQCAQWCREWLSRDPDATLGVVVPDLAAQRLQVERIFREVLAPASLFTDAAVELPFNLSHADPLAHQPLVDAALTLLGWTQAPVGLNEIAALARSPHLAGHPGEWPQRALIVRELAETPQDLWRPAELAQFARARSPIWSAHLSALASASAQWRKARPAKEWRRAWEDALAAAGWLTDATLDSVEYQGRRAWDELLDDWMRAESIFGRMRFPDAYSSLRRLMTETAFQPERGAVPVQVLGTLEASGLHFDGLWMCGLTAERWPAAPQPTPLLPLAWQRMVQAPHASAERELRYHRELTAQFAAAAPTVVFSWPASVEGIPAAASPLLAEFASKSSAVPANPLRSLSMQLAQTAALTTWDDALGLRLDPESPAIGRVALLEAQANCPFQAYAAFRLEADPWPQRCDGLTPAERGTLVHCMLAEFWRALPDQRALLALESDARSSRCEAAVNAALNTLPAQRWALLGEVFRDLEGARLLGLLRDWLEVECGRPRFTVVATESKQASTVDGLELRLKVDRIDRISDDQLIVIDFKTGKSTIADLLHEQRLIAPQLPLYAEAVEPGPVVAVAYATVRLGESKVSGIAASRATWSALKAADPDWPTVRARWRTQLQELVGEYRRGVARVDPWHYPATCDRCGRHALCRISEHIAFVDRDRRAIGSVDDEVDAQ